LVSGSNSNVQAQHNQDQSDNDQSDDSNDVFVTQSPRNDELISDDESTQADEQPTGDQEIQVSSSGSAQTLSPGIPLRRRSERERSIHTPQTARIIHAQEAIGNRAPNKRTVRHPEKYTPEPKKRKQ
jgi:hypothetical protein